LSCWQVLRHHSGGLVQRMCGGRVFHQPFQEVY
jgi:hypothetical protein